MSSPAAQVLAEQAKDVPEPMLDQLAFTFLQAAASDGMLIGPTFARSVSDPTATVPMTPTSFARDTPGARYLWLLNQVPPDLVDNTLAELGVRTPNRAARAFAAEALLFAGLDQEIQRNQLVPLVRGAQRRYQYQRIEETDDPTIPPLSEYQDQYSTMPELMERFQDFTKDVLAAAGTAIDAASRSTTLALPPMLNS